MRLLPNAAARDRRRALVVAAINDQPASIRMLIDAGEDPNRFNPLGAHAHSTPLHQAIAAGSLNAARTLIERGARADIRDRDHDDTPPGWAIHCQQPESERYLRSIGVTD